MRYVIANDSEEERTRLRLLAELTDPYTCYRLETIGVGPGWRCLEIGAGLGTVSTWLADKIGREGEVVCTDLQTKFLEDVDHPRIHVEQLDILQEPQRHEAFDLAVARNVHHHIPDRLAAMRNLVEMVKPGGHILYVEPDLHPAMADFHPVWRRAFEAFRQWGEQHDIDLFTGRRLPHQLSAAGLDIVSARGETALFSGKGGDPAVELYRRTFALIMDDLVAMGFLSQADGDEVYRLLDSEQAWLMNFCFFAVHARKSG